MGNRYGRNKRRRAREQIAALTDKIDILQVSVRVHAIAHLESMLRIRELTEEIDRSKEILTPYFIGFEAPEVDFDHKFEDGDKVIMPLIEPISIDVSTGETTGATFQQLPLDVMVVHCEKSAYQSMVHCKVSYKGEAYAYGVTAQSLRNMGNNQAALTISRAISGLIADSLQKI